LNANATSLGREPPGAHANRQFQPLGFAGVPIANGAQAHGGVGGALAERSRQLDLLPELVAELVSPELNRGHGLRALGGHEFQTGKNGTHQILLSE
jgi:hypothetical protein